MGGVHHNGYERERRTVLCAQAHDGYQTTRLKSAARARCLSHRLVRCSPIASTIAVIVATYFAIHAASKSEKCLGVALDWKAARVCEFAIVVPFYSIESKWATMGARG